MRGGTGIWRALDQARALNLGAAGEPPATRGGDNMTRRRVLAALAGAAGSLALPAATLAQGSRPRVAIVGGGLAGLVALHRLRSRGVDATVYEARGAVGGRTRSADFAPGLPIDLGGQLINSDHEDMRQLARMLGLRLVNRNAYGPARELQIGADGRVIAEEELAQALRPIAARITADADRLDRDYEGVAPRIDGMSAAAYLDRHGLAAGPAREVLEAGLRTEYGGEPDEVSALELIFNLPTVDGVRLTRLSLSDEAQLVDGGAGQIAARLGDRLAPHIRLNRQLRAVQLSAGSVRLAFADGQEVSADRLILALPASLLRDIRFDGPLPALWREAFGALELGANEKLVVGYDRQAWWPSTGFSGALWASHGFSEAWDAVSAVPRPGPGVFCYFLGGDQVAAAQGEEMRSLAARFTALSAQALPGLPPPNGRLRRTEWTRDPLTRGSYIRFRPGQITRFASLLTLEEEGEPARAARAGPLFLAGEWVSDAFPGYMNGAAQTGRIAADAALRSLRAVRAGG